MLKTRFLPRLSELSCFPCPHPQPVLPTGIILRAATQGDRCCWAFGRSRAQWLEDAVREASNPTSFS